MRTRLLSIILSLFIVFSILAASCGPDGTDETTGQTPQYEITQCLFTPPAGYDIECGYLSVPENRDYPDGTMIKIYFAIFRTTNPNPEPDPIVYLAGGPGENALDVAELVFNQRFAPLMDNRDLIIVDQRGTGYSEPSLFSTEMLDNFYEYLDDDLTYEEGIALQKETLRETYDRFVGEGIDLNCYNSAENAADLNDLRVALGYEEWNLFGVSYGTRLALTMMRDHPEGIRSVILGSTVPVQANLYVDMPDNFNRSLDLLYATCAADPKSNAAYPDLENVLFETVEKMNESPVMVTVTHPFTMESYDALINGDSLLSFVFEWLYSTESIPLLPKIIYDASEGKYDTLAVLMSNDFVNAELSSNGMYYSVQFSEEYPFNTAEDVAAAIAKYPEMTNFLSASTDLGGAIYEIEQYWNTEEADPIENEAVTSDIPALIIAGEYDPITPPSWGQMVAETLENSYFFEFPGFSHDAPLSGDECILDVIYDFLDDPDEEPDGTCITGIEEDDFVTLDISLVDYSNTLFGFSSVAPEGWEELMPGGWQRSPLGLTAIIQQAAPGANESILPVLLNSLGIDTDIEPVETRNVNGLSWAMYQTKIQGLITDFFITEKDDVSYFILFSGVEDDHDYYYDELLIPTLEAFTPTE